jgi:hypothetical protein
MAITVDDFTDMELEFTRAIRTESSEEYLIFRLIQRRVPNWRGLPTTDRVSVASFYNMLMDPYPDHSLAQT